MTEKKKLVISTEIYAAFCDYQVLANKVGMYTALTNDDYEADFMHALKEIEESKRNLNKLIRSAQKV